MHKPENETNKILCYFKMQPDQQRCKQFNKDATRSTKMQTVQQRCNQINKDQTENNI